MMKRLLGVILLGFTVMVGLTAPVYADEFSKICDSDKLDPQVKADVCEGVMGDDRSLMDVVVAVINVAVGVIGLMAVIVIIFAGQRYITATGDPGKLKMAKDMIIWGLVGLILAMLSYAIVNFIVAAVAG